MCTIIPDSHPLADKTLGDVAELNARRTAAEAVASDFHAAAVAFQRGGQQPDYASWAFRLEQHLFYVLRALGALGGPDDDRDDEDLEDDFEPYCARCGASVGIFIAHGDAWLHYTGE